MDTNSVILIGRLTRDAELRYANNGTAFSRLSLAVSGYKENETSFFDITLFGKTAENLNQYLTKGTQISVQGSLKQDTWEKDGQKNSKVSIIAQQIQLLGKPKDSGGSKETYTQYKTLKEPTPPVQAFQGPETFQDDIPF